MSRRFVCAILAALGVASGFASAGGINDFDGDNRSDATVYHAPTGIWFSRLSTSGATEALGYGGVGYSPISGNFDGDAFADRTVYYAGFWFVRQSSTGTTFSLSFGGPGYLPVARDYDGDNKTDIAVFHPPSGLWFIRRSLDSVVTTTGFGGAGYTPVPGDYDDDGKADIALFHEPSGLWFIKRSTDGGTTTVGFGGPGYVPVARDYDGDGAYDLAVFHPPSGLWFIRRSSDLVVTTTGFGTSTFFPMPADYDGDNKADLAVYSMPTGDWYVKRSTDGGTITFNFGGNTYEHVNLAPLFPNINSDSDGDGIKDADETYGTTGGLNLPGMGTTRLRKDILLEYDWFDDNTEPGTCGAHSHRPTAAIVNAVSAAFGNSPVTNPSGQTGVNMIHDYGQGGLFTGGTLVADIDGVNDGILTGGVNNVAFQNTKNANILPNRNGYFHYTILPHQYGSAANYSSGQAELPGDDLIVSLYCYGSTGNVANTIVHELGHNLNLRHGGFENCNWKPNYNSVMNYKYQFPGIDNNCTPAGNGVLSYSIGNRISLNEASLNENLGTCGTPAVDWNGDLAITTPVAWELNREGDLPNDPISAGFASCTDQTMVLNDYNDWANLVFTGLTDGDGQMLFKELIDCTNRPPMPAPKIP